MRIRNGLARFCPYNTLKKGAPAFENNYRQRIRVLKTNFIYFIVAVIVLIPVAYSLSLEPPTKLVALSDLQVKVITDKNEYRVNDTIKAALYICNNHSYPVRIEPIREILIAGNSVSDPEKISSIAFLDYPADIQYLFIKTNSSRRIFEIDFRAELSGEFLINMLGRSKTVNVIEN